MTPGGVIVARRGVLLALVVLGACKATPHPSVDVPGADTADAVTDAGGAAQDAPAELSSVLEPIRVRYGLPALAAAVFDDDSTIAQGAVGLRALGQDVAVTLDDRWHLGSDTKAMTATLVARFVERGVIRWETTLAEAFPDDAAVMLPAYRTVTLERLLQHRGGVVGNLLAHPSIWNSLWTSRQPVVEQRRAFVRQVLTLPPEVAVGQYLYANAGYMLAGHALERATGRSWEELLRAEVFAPLAMRSCGFGAPAMVGTTDAPWGHRARSDASVPVAPGPQADNPPALGPAGTVHCPLSDWGRFAQLHLRGARGVATNYLRPETFARMHNPPAGGSYALGWGVAPRSWAGDLPALTHQGSNTMFLCSAWIAPSRRRVLLVATNAADDRASSAVEAALTAMIGAWVPR